MAKIEVEFTQCVEVGLDETKFTEEFMAEFRQYFYPFETIKEHAQHIAQMVARGLYDQMYEGSTQFIEGYGPANEMGITAKIIWDEIE